MFLLLIICCLSLSPPFTESFVDNRFLSRSQLLQRRSHDYKVVIHCVGKDGDSFLGEEDQQMRRDALELLDCLTSSKNEDDVNYDVEKDIRRDTLLAENDYLDLKVELKRRGLRTSGDKLEMITRLLLHIVDPSIDVNEMTGREPNLKYISLEDIAAGDVKIIPQAERNKADEDTGPDAEDMMVLRRGPKSKNLKNIEAEKELTVMDGLVRRQVTFPLIPDMDLSDISTPTSDVNKVDIDPHMMNAYVVGGRDVLRTWERNRSPVVILLPDERSWKRRETRLLADELSFSNQVIVIVPEIEIKTTNNQLPLIGEKPSRGVKSYILSNIILQRILAVVQYSRQQFSSRSVSLCGVGLAGGLALEAAAELSTLSSCYNLFLGLPQRGPAMAPRKLELTYVQPASIFTDDERRQLGLEELGQEELQQEHLLDTNLNQVGAAVILGTAGLEGQLESDLLGDEVNAEDVAAMLGDIDIDVIPQGTVASKDSSSNAEVLDANSYIKTAMASFGLSTDYSNLLEKAKLSGLLRTAAVFCPSGYNLAMVGKNLRVPTFLAFGENGLDEGSRLVDIKAIKELLSTKQRKLSIPFSIRVYEGRENSFIQNPKSTEDSKCAQEALSIASVWLEVFSRDLNDDPTDGVSSDTVDEDFATISPYQLREPIRASSVATHVHDDPNFFSI